MRGRTTLIIAHRLSTIGLADRVVLLEDGRIVADGTHAELMATEPRYAEVLAHIEEDEAATSEAADRSQMRWVPRERHRRRVGRLLRGLRVAWAAVRRRPRLRRRRPSGQAAGRPAVRRHPARAAGARRQGARAASRSTRPSEVTFSQVDYDRRPLTLRRFLGPHWIALLGAFVLVVVETAAMQAGPLLTQIGIDDGIRQKEHDGRRHRRRRSTSAPS